MRKEQIGKEFGNESHLHGAQAGDRPGMQPVGITSPMLVPWAPFSYAAVVQIVHVAGLHSLLGGRSEEEARKPKELQNSSHLKKQVIAVTVSRATVLMENNQSQLSSHPPLLPTRRTTLLLTPTALTEGWSCAFRV